MEVAEQDTHVDQNKKVKLFQLKYHNSINKFPLTTKSNGNTNNKITLRGQNGYKPLRRAESTVDNFFPQNQEKNTAGTRSSLQDQKKSYKLEGFDLGTRNQDGLKKFEPIGRTLQTFQQQRKNQYLGLQNSANSLSKKGEGKLGYNNFAPYTVSVQKMGRANSSQQGFKTLNNFMKTSEGFNIKRPFNFPNGAYNNLLESRLNTNKNNNNLKDNNQNNENNSIHTSNSTRRPLVKSESRSSHRFGSTISNNFNYKKQTVQDKPSSPEQQTTETEYPSRTQGSERTITKKKLNDAVNRASLYNDEMIKIQHMFVQQEQEEEEQFQELCDVLNSLVIEK